MYELLIPGKPIQIGLNRMNASQKEEIKNYIEEVVQRELEKHMKLYSSEELLTRAEFFKAMEIIQQRFEAVDRRFEAVDRRFEVLINEIKELKVQTGSIGDREGRDFEKTIREILNESIKKRFIDITKIERLKVVDTQGERVLPNQKVEMDIFASDGRKVLMEVKFHMTAKKVTNFYLDTQFIEKRKGFTAEKLIIAIEIDEDAIELAKELGIGIISKNFSL